MTGNDFLMEKRLMELDPGLHRRVSDSLFALRHVLSRYLVYFPEYTDHAETHSMAVIEYCNNLIGEKRIMEMNADELYVLLMACYLHDIGMGLFVKDYEEFLEHIDFGDYFETHETISEREVIRAFHNDFSACFIEKYYEVFDIPTKEHVFAIAQTARGHRKADLYDEQAYPSTLTFHNGNTVCLPYLAAIIRMGDEVNVAEDRNSKILFNLDNYSTETQRLENEKHRAIKRMTIYPNRIELDVNTKEQDVFAAVSNLAIKLQRTLDYCREVVEHRTPYEITQKKIVMNTIEEER